MSEEIPYQIAPQVEALRQERENCVAYGNDRRIAAIDRALAELGVKAEAAEKRAEASGGQTKAPQGRSSKPKSETTEA